MTISTTDDDVDKNTHKSSESQIERHPQCGMDGWKGEHQKSIKGLPTFFFLFFPESVRYFVSFRIYFGLFFSTFLPLFLSLFKGSVSYFFLVFGTSFFELTRNSYKLQRPAYDYVARVSLCVLYRFYIPPMIHTHPWASRFDFIIIVF